jgi:hypothetical protein
MGKVSIPDYQAPGVNPDNNQPIEEGPGPSHGPMEPPSRPDPYQLPDGPFS